VVIIPGNATRTMLHDLC